MIEFNCRPVPVASGPEGATPEWVEVACYHHDDPYMCGHHHRRWGPVSRCMTRHVADTVEAASVEETSRIV